MSRVLIQTSSFVRESKFLLKLRPPPTDDRGVCWMRRSMLSSSRSDRERVALSQPLRDGTVALDVLKVLLLNSAAAATDKRFHLDVRKSSIPNAGYGVFCERGSISKHSLVCLYPGQYYPPPPAWCVASVDGDTSAYSANFFDHMIVQQERSTSVYQIHCNNSGGHIDAAGNGPLHGYPSYAVGHLINHPSKPLRPNVSPCDFLWDNIFDHFMDRCSEEHREARLLQELIQSRLDAVYDCPTDRGVFSAGRPCNESIKLSIRNYLLKLARAVNSIGHGAWYVDPSRPEGPIVQLTPDCAPLVGMAIIASEDISAGSELLMDYRYEDAPLRSALMKFLGVTHGCSTTRPGWYSCD